MKNSLVSLLLISLAACTAFADGGDTTKNTAGGCNDAQKGAQVVTQHQLTLNGKTVNYSATVGFLEVVVDPGLFSGAFPAATATATAKACMFYTAYQIAPAPGAAQRPLTFAFNGGPGSASLWLHLGVGPRRINMGTDGTNPPVPFQLEDNADTPLDLSDMVFIDPVATGFSVPETGSNQDQFFGAYNDAESVATFIRTFTDTFKREDSPIYVMGESYGGIRGSLVAQLLQLPLYLPLKGVIFVSPCLSNTITEFGVPDLDVAYWTFFPTFATTAWYQKVAGAKYLSMDVESTFQAAQNFANTRLADALRLGNALPDAEFHAVAQEMSEFTGIPQSQIEDRHLRLRDTDFFGWELESKHQIVGRFDSRFVGAKLSTQNGATANDPSDLQTGFPYVSAINSYLRNDLGFTTTAPYVDGANITSWPFNSDGAEFDAAANLSQAFADNSKLQVFVIGGYYDLACPIGTVEYERSHLDIDSAGASRMAIHHYPSGHMAYINPIAMHEIKSDLADFYTLTGAGVPISQK
jgi:carboxypeptidase C (cathepsin A)